jgi:hypothetical protein
VRYKRKQALSTVVQQMSCLVNPNLVNKNAKRKPSSSQRPSSGIIVFRTPQQLIINATKLSKRENIDAFVLPLGLGNPQPGIHRKGFHPSAEKLNPPGRIGKRGLSLVNTPIHMGVHEGRGDSKKGECHQSDGNMGCYLSKSK